MMELTSIISPFPITRLMAHVIAHTGPMNSRPLFSGRYRERKLKFYNNSDLRKRTEESLRQRRSWGKNLTFYTGSAYLASSISGAAVGFSSALRNFEKGDTLKLKINRILNSSGHPGRTWGNRIAVVGLIYAGMESGIIAMTDRDDVWSSLAAGLATGAVCRAGRGVRSAAISGAVGGLAGGAVVAGKQVVKRYVPI